MTSDWLLTPRVQRAARLARSLTAYRRVFGQRADPVLLRMGRDLVSEAVHRAIAEASLVDERDSVAEVLHDDR